MAISYKNLWKLLIDRDMKKKDLQELAGISAASITKLGKNEYVNTEIISKTYSAPFFLKPRKYRLSPVDIQSGGWKSSQISC